MVRKLADYRDGWRSDVVQEPGDSQLGGRREVFEAVAIASSRGKAVHPS
jgi:hypothetical protein